MCGLCACVLVCACMYKSLVLLLGDCLFVDYNCTFNTIYTSPFCLFHSVAEFMSVRTRMCTLDVERSDGGDKRRINPHHIEPLCGNKTRIFAEFIIICAVEAFESSTQCNELRFPNHLKCKYAFSFT